MGTKYSTTAISGYNATPPADDGSVAGSNQLFWSTIKTKLPDPIKTALESIDTKLVTAADLGPVAKITTYTTVAGDHEKTLECSGTFTVSLMTAASAGSGYTVEVNNQGVDIITVSRATGADTINGTAADVTIAAKNSLTFRCNSSANGYDIIGGALPWLAASTSISSSVTLGANTFTADQTIQSTDAGAGVGPLLVLDRDSASPADSDLLGKVKFQGNDSAASNEEYANVYAKIIDKTAGTEDAQLITQTVIAGTLADRLKVGAGIVVGSATGGDQGAGTINATAIYDDGVLITAGAAAASQAEMEAASSNTVMATPGRVKFAPSAAKAWVNFTGTGTVTINASNNVTSITDNGTGDYTVNFTIAFSSANYCAVYGGQYVSANSIALINTKVATTPTASAINLSTVAATDGTIADVTTVHAAFYGDQ